jgi:histidinol-phosphatase (PHP family)
VTGLAVLPADGHVHTEWSWDAAAGSMERSCARAVELGLPAVAFTEHADWACWPVIEEELRGHEHLAPFVTDGVLTTPALDVNGYVASVERCRDLFPGLRIISGVELGEPHRHGDVASRLLAAGGFERVLGSLHCLPRGDDYSEPPVLYLERAAADVVRAYLTEIPQLVAGYDDFGVLAHIDYVVRTWPEHAGRFDPRDFEDEFRNALRVLAGSGRALEVNTAGPCHVEIVRWWREEGGRVVTFGSDAHEPMGLARGFRDAVAMVEAHGFRPGRHPYDVWTR